MRNFLITQLGKSICTISKLTNSGSGSTWPGHVALKLNKNYIKELLKDSSRQIVLIAGTNGKTTTGKILTTILKKNGKNVFQNSSGANLINGIASSLLLHTNFSGKLTTDFAIFEVDENNLPLVLQELTPQAIIVLDLFRDQLDRYGELDGIARNWQQAFEKLPSTTHLILNADDPLIAYLGTATKATVSYFGLDPTKTEGQSVQHAADSLYCPRCSNKLQFSKIVYSHLGLWKCPHCKLQRPIPNLADSFYPLEGTYNKYNTLAASLTAQTLGFSRENIDQALHAVTPAFGRQEKLVIQGKQIQLFLAKNPTSFNESLKTIVENNNKSFPRRVGNPSAKVVPLWREGQGEGSRLRSNNKLHVLFVLNDRIPDGRDVSWIWDIDMEQYIEKLQRITISGDRCWDMTLRINYSMQFPISNFQFSNSKIQTYKNLKLALKNAIKNIPVNETLYILPTYSAMLEVRRILTGRKIL